MIEPEKLASTHAQVKWHNRRIHNQGSDVPGRRKLGERSGVSTCAQMIEHYSGTARAVRSRETGGLAPYRYNLFCHFTCA